MLFLAMLIGFTSWEYARGHRWTGMHERHKQLVTAGRELNHLLPKDAWIAVTNAGRLPYFAERRTLDMMGLSDAHIARSKILYKFGLVPGHLKGDGGYILDRAPELIMFLGLVVSEAPLARDLEWLKTARRKAIGISERQIVLDPRFLEQYRLISIPLPGVSAWLNVFAREGAFGSGIPSGAIPESRGDF
jgi:hypothetical protein